MDIKSTVPEPQQSCCPLCGASLPADASFCPHCARSVRPRTWRKAPRPLQKKFLYLAALLTAAAIAAGGIWLYTRPQTVEDQGGVIYTDESGTYQVVLGKSDGTYEPLKELPLTAEQGQEYRFPLCVTFFDSKTGENVSHAMGGKIESSYVTIEPLTETDCPWKHTEPAHSDARPTCALTTFINFYLESGDARLTWTLRMTNGDTLRMHTQLLVEEIPTAHFYPDTTPMQTIEELQALIDNISVTIPQDTIVYVHLPAVTYHGGLTINNYSLRLLGSQEGQTVFTGTIQIGNNDGYISYFDRLNLLGSGSGIGLSAASRVHLTNCTISGWKTGVLAYGKTWVNAMDCCFEDNRVGFHFNASNSSPTHSTYSNNRFARNDTAVLLESIPTDISLKFHDSIFTENGIDIDNRCNHALDISQAIFS